MDENHMLKHAWRLVLIGGPWEGHEGLAYRMRTLPPQILVGLCREAREPGCRGVEHPHTWWWLTTERHRPYDAVVYRLAEQEEHRHRHDGQTFHGIARYVISGVSLPERRTTAAARG
jgi:hypothetical protein